MTATMINTEYARFLQEATEEVFEKMIFMAAEAGDPEPPTQGYISGELVASLGFTGTANGVLVTTCPMALARSITANMLGTEESEVGGPSEVGDALGEVTNMIAGSIKNRWVARGNRMDLSIPIVAMAASLKASLGPSRVEGAKVHFLVEEHAAPFSVELRFEEGPGR